MAIPTLDPNHCHYYAFGPREKPLEFWLEYDDGQGLQADARSRTSVLSS